MTPTTPELERLLQHYAGHHRLQKAFDRPDWHRGRGRRGDIQFSRLSKASTLEPRTEMGEAVMVSPERRLLGSLSDSFGKKEFKAGVCFVDMVGFSQEASGKSPKEIAALVSPFLRAVLAAATKNSCFADKTIGDEVMVVMPVFPSIQDPFSDMVWFLADVVNGVQVAAPGIAFRAGVAFGNVFLDDIEAEGYHEWSVFGNCVNGAKRLQTLPSRSIGNEGISKYRAVLGAIDAEDPSIREALRHCLDTLRGRWEDRFVLKLPVEFLNSRIDCEDLKGVGRMWFLETFLSPKKTRP